MITLLYTKIRGDFMSEDHKKIEVVNGDGKDLEISEVSTHISTLRPKVKDEDDDKQEILVPKPQKKECKKNKK